ncbi:MAG: hypothetical protein M3280_09560 [Actinomycetota bacterium]|nr:hypothetical protein [Actinomycetota bacterium]
MNLMTAIKITRGLFWFLVGTAMLISGIVYTIRGAVSGFKDEWYAGPIAMVLGVLLAGYFPLFRAIRSQSEAKDSLPAA